MIFQLVVNFCIWSIKMNYGQWIHTPEKQYDVHCGIWWLSISQTLHELVSDDNSALLTCSFQAFKFQLHFRPIQNLPNTPMEMLFTSEALQTYFSWKQSLLTIKIRWDLEAWKSWTWCIPRIFKCWPGYVQFYLQISICIVWYCTFQSSCFLLRDKLL